MGWRWVSLFYIPFGSHRAGTRCTRGYQNCQPVSVALMSSVPCFSLVVILGIVFTLQQGPELGWARMAHRGLGHRHRGAGGLYLVAAPGPTAGLGRVDAAGALYHSQLPLGRRLSLHAWLRRVLGQPADACSICSWARASVPKVPGC